jgi:hypothetical protein
MFKLAKGIIIICIILTIIGFVLYGVALVEVIQHPESVGQFFGKIVSGFNSVSK